MYLKGIPRGLAVTEAGDPCNPVDGLFFIWTLMSFGILMYNNDVLFGEEIMYECREWSYKEQQQ